MDPERWRRVEEIYHKALEFEPNARAAFLETACESDQELRREVESLIAQGDSNSRGPIDRPVWAHDASSAETSESRRLLPGVQVGAYRIEAPLGAGGMGIVYNAIDTKLNRRVAIKLVSTRGTDTTTRRRFRREAETASSLNHPHILTVHDIGEFEESQYLVTEFVDGGTLKDWAGAAARTWEEVVDLLVGIADGLATAHAAGVVHRDVKPTNILVTKNRYAKLADFGLARIDEIAREGMPPWREDLTRPGMVVGTVAYMSPEQASGKPLDARSDIFSFGVVLYELLANRKPFQGDTDFEVQQAIVVATPEPVSEAIPVSLRAIVEKTLEKDVAKRYQSMRDVVVDLKRVQQEISAAQRSDRALETARPLWASRRIAAIVVGLLSVIAFGIAWSLTEADYFWRNPLAGARTEQLTDFPGDEMDAAVSRDGTFTAFLSDRDGPFDVWLNEVGTDRFENVTRGSIETTVPAVIRRIGFAADDNQLWISEGERSGPYKLLQASALGGPRPFLDHAMEPAWSPDGTMMAYHTAAPGDPIFIADRSGRNPRRIFAAEPGVHCHHLTWSPDGRFIYFAKGFPTTEEMDIWRIAAFPSGLAEPERVTTHNAMVAYLGWLDERTLIYAGTAQDGSGQWLYALDVERRVPHRVSSGITEQYLSVAVSTTEPRRLIASVATPTSTLWTVPISSRIQSEADVTRLPIPNARALSPRAASGYVLFLSSRGAGGDGLWTLKDNAVQPEELWKGTGGGVIAAPAISTDGTRICFSYRTQGRSHLYLMNTDGLNVRLLTDSFDVRSPASWSSDGKWIVVAGSDGQGTYLFKVSAEDGTAIRLTDTVAYNPVWSPTEPVIVYSEPLGGSTFGTRGITPDKMPVEVPDIRVSYVMGTPYRFHPDGELIYVKDGPLMGGTRNFYAINLRTGQERRLTDLKTSVQMRTFDVMPDGKQIVFDRLRQNSNIAVIDLPR